MRETRSGEGCSGEGALSMMRLGRWTALASFFLGIAYVIAVALGVTLGGTTKPIGDPVLAVMELLTLIGALLLVVVMAAVHEYADAEPPKLAPLPDDEPLARRAGAAVDDSDERRRYAKSLERASRGTFARSGCLTWAMPIASCVVVLAAVLLGLGGAFAWAEGTSTTSPSPSQEVARPLSYPTGWTAHPVPSSEDWDCARSRIVWHVAITPEGALKIERHLGNPEMDPVPFAVPHWNTGGAETTGIIGFDRRLGSSGSSGARHVLPVTDGFIFGFGRGEYGGRVFWFSKEGTNSYDLSPLPRTGTALDTVCALAPIGSDVLIFGGLAPTLDSGRVFRAHRAADGRWSATRFARLPSAPRVVVAEPSGDWIVAVSTGIVRVRRSGRVENIWSERYLGTQYPNSGVRLADGTIFIGMRYFVLRLRPRGTTYDVDVLVAPGCSTTRCECVQSARPDGGGVYPRPSATTQRR